MALDPIIQAIVDQSKAAEAPQPATNEERVQQTRDGYAMMRAIGGEDAPVASVDDRTIPGPAGEIPIRIYTPEGDGPVPPERSPSGSTPPRATGRSRPKAR